ncbi:MAG: peptidase S41 [Porphyrobacter sp.]|nr:peptidase S41 [Porphyrobacter sp.]
MNIRRTLIAALSSCALVGCGGGGGSAPPTAGGGTPTPTPATAACSLRAQQDFADGVLNEWYLFPTLLANANPAAYSTLQSYLDARVAPARAQNRDRYFTYATSIAEENALINSGASAGFGIRLFYNTGANRVFVTEAFEGGNGLAAGLDRGSEITAIGTSANNLQSVASLMASGGPQAVVDALGPSDPGVTRVLRFVQPGGATIERSITKTAFSLDPVSDRYGSLVLDDGGRKVGYINLRTFIIADAADQLRTAFGQFRAQGITDLIIDLRYNGGGLVDVADTLGDLMGQGRVGQVWSRTVLNANKSSQNSTRAFRSEANAIAPMRIAFIGTNATASASELTINSMIPYLGSNMALVGGNTFGKPVGQLAFDRDSCDLRLRVIAFKTLNAAGQGDYYTGLAPVVPNTCRAGDDITHPLGDPQEASIAAALDFLGGRACTPIAGSGTPDTAVVGDSAQRARIGLDLPERKPLAPRRPGAGDEEIPGKF